MPNFTWRQVPLSGHASITSRGFEDSTGSASTTRGRFGPAGPRTSALLTRQPRFIKAATSDLTNSACSSGTWLGYEAPGNASGLYGAFRDVPWCGSVRNSKRAHAVLEVREQVRSLWVAT